MSHDQSRFKNSQRRYQDEVAVQKQLTIAKSASYSDDHRMIKQPHRMVKHHALDCGRPQCMLCGNPRKLHKDKLTVQEKRQLQELDDFKNSNEKDVL